MTANQIIALGAFSFAAAAGVLVLFVILRAAALQADGRPRCADKVEPDDIEEYGAQEGLR